MNSFSPKHIKEAKVYIDATLKRVRERVRKKSWWEKLFAYVKGTSQQ